MRKITLALIGSGLVALLGYFVAKDRLPLIGQSSNASVLSYALAIDEKLTHERSSQEYRYGYQVRLSYLSQFDVLVQIQSQAEANATEALATFDQGGILQSYRMLNGNSRPEARYVLRLLLENLQFPSSPRAGLIRTEKGLNGDFTASYQSSSPTTWQKTKAQIPVDSPLALQSNGAFTYVFGKNNRITTISGRQTTALKHDGRDIQSGTYAFDLAPLNQELRFPNHVPQDFEGKLPLGLETADRTRIEKPSMSLDDFLAEKSLSDQKTQTDDLTNLENLLRYDPADGKRFVEAALKQAGDDLRFHLLALALARSEANQDDFASLLVNARDKSQLRTLALYLNDAAAPTPAMLDAAWKLADSTDESIKTRSSLALGSMSEKMTLVDQKVKILEGLQHHFESANDAFEKSVWIASMGNSGDPVLFPTIRQAVASDDKGISSAAVNALRLYPRDDIFPILRDYLTDAHASDATVALKVLRELPLTEDQLSQLKSQKQALHDKTVISHLDDVIQTKEKK